MLANQSVMHKGMEFVTAVTQRKNSPTFSAKIRGITITVMPTCNGTWRHAPWCDSESTNARLAAKFS